MGNAHTIDDLRQMQAAPLSVKVRMTQSRIRDWVNWFGVDGVYVSFSGGKDSTVLLHLVREMYPEVPAVFCDTGLEFPEIRQFVKTFDNVTWLKPKMTFRQVIEKYGYPFISKEVSQNVYDIRKYGKKESLYAYDRFNPNSQHNKKYNGRYSLEKYSFLLSDDAPMLTGKCCTVMKKDIAKRYEKQQNRKSIIGTLASESRLRTMSWIKYGCNAFDAKRQSSKPMSFWTEQDVLNYIKENHVRIAPIYGEVVEAGELTGQMTWDDYCGFQTGEKILKTTGRQRTGCMFCGFGCKPGQSGENNFVDMKRTHPKQYEYIMKPWSEGGLGYKDVIDWLNEHGNLNIRY